MPQPDRSPGALRRAQLGGSVTGGLNRAGVVAVGVASQGTLVCGIAAVGGKPRA